MIFQRNTKRDLFRLADLHTQITTTAATTTTTKNSNNNDDDDDDDGNEDNDAGNVTTAQFF